MESIPLPDFVVTLWVAAGIAFLVGLGITLWAKDQGSPGGIAAFLLPFAIPTMLVAAIALIVSLFGSLLLTLGKQIAVPVALAGALIILGVCAAMAQSGDEAVRSRH